jgi:hypothetical protein
MLPAFLDEGSVIFNRSARHLDGIARTVAAISGNNDEPSPFVDIELHQALVAHFQQEGLANFFTHDIGAFHNLVRFERLLAERTQDIFSIIQHD